MSATCSQYTTTICCSHSFTETVFVSSFTVRRLECSFHCFNILIVLLSTNSGCKGSHFFRHSKLFPLFFAKNFRLLLKYRAFIVFFSYLCTRFLQHFCDFISKSPIVSTFLYLLFFAKLSFLTAKSLKYNG